MIELLLGFGLGYLAFTENGKKIVDAGKVQGKKLIDEIKSVSKPDEKSLTEEADDLA